MFDHRVVLNSIDDLSLDLVQVLQNFAPNSTRNILKKITDIRINKAERKEEKQKFRSK